tara:strand:+ start:316 stop:738 length:423 start_codon:yes stop_codon:yes gene_type:complete
MAFNDDMVKLVMQVFDGSLIKGITVSVDGVYRSVRTSGTYSPITGSVTREVRDFPIKVIKKVDSAGVSSGSSGKEAIIDDKSAISKRDFLEFMITPITGILPEQGIDDELILSEKTYKVMSIESKNLGPNRLVYILVAVG